MLAIILLNKYKINLQNKKRQRLKEKKCMDLSEMFTQDLISRTAVKSHTLSFEQLQF